jgi:hypothetical protein
MAKYIAIRASYGFRGRKWEEGQEFDSQAGEKIPPHFKPAGSLPAAKSPAGPGDKEQLAAKKAAEAQAKADAAFLKGAVAKMTPEQKAAYEALTPEERAAKDKEFLDAKAAADKAKADEAKAKEAEKAAKKLTPKTGKAGAANAKK